MQTQCDRKKKFIMVYQDHLTKFVRFRASQLKRAKEFSYLLNSVFLTPDALPTSQSVSR
jgi:hypothetical protein